MAMYANGNESPTLRTYVSDETKVSFLNVSTFKSAQVPWTYFFFVLQLVEEENIDSILGDCPEDPIFMVNPLFLHFIFWFLSKKCNEDYFTFDNVDEACEILDSYIHNRIHRMLGSAELTAEFPAIDFLSALQTNDQVNLGHFGRMLERPRKMKYLVIPFGDSKGWILNSILPTCRVLKVMDKEESGESWKCVLPDFSRIDENKTGILLSDKAHRRWVLKDLCEIAVQSNRQLVVYLYVNEGQTVDLSDALRQGVEKLVIGAAQAGTKVTYTRDFIHCPFLTELSIIGQGQLYNHLMRAISRAVREGKLPRLQNLSFVGMKIKGQLKNLLEGQTIQTKLTHLNLCNSDLMKNDLQALCLASNSELLRNLRSLHLADGNFVLRQRRDIFSQNWVNLATLSVKLTRSGFQELMQAITQSSLTNLRKLSLSMLPNEMCDLGKMQPDKLPNLEHLAVQRCITSRKDLKHVSRMLTHWTLHTLDISHSRSITGELSVMTSQDLNSLRNLILCDCELNECDRNSLAQANEEGRIPNLESLDLSENCHLIETFGAIASKWCRLQKLTISEQPHQFFARRNGFETLLPLLGRGYIPAIRGLRISGGYSFPERLGRWKHLERLDILSFQLSSIFRQLVNAVEMGELPALQTVCLLPSKGSPSIDTEIFTMFSQKSVDVCIIDPYLEDVMINADLI